MDFDFDLEWTLRDAQIVTRDECIAYDADPTEKNRRALVKKAEMFKKSIEVINQSCKAELANYRESVAYRDPWEVQQVYLEELYKKYSKLM